MKMNAKEKIMWHAHRLKAMSMREIGWRISQRLLQMRERKRFTQGREVASELFYDRNWLTGGHTSPAKDRATTRRMAAEAFNADFAGLQFDAVPHYYAEGARPALPGGFRHENFRHKWHAGFQTENEWPLEFAYDLDIRQRHDIGDVRINWELNRHHQFPMMAVDYMVTGKNEYLTELADAFDDWNRMNPFLWGVTWTSCMEVAIRSISWMMTLAFLRKCGTDLRTATLRRLEESLAVGIINMTEYVLLHRSRHSSANNHLIVEMAAVGMAGYAFRRKEWQQTAFDILNIEMERQNWPDGVNKEMSLHYHAFVMEAYLLTAHCMQANGDKVPAIWRDLLGGMAAFLGSSMASETCAMEFGDSDEGKILNLGGDRQCYYRYILQFASFITGHRFRTFEHPEATIEWLFSAEELKDIKNAILHTPYPRRTFKMGGYTFLRDAADTILIGIDHAPLGFGSIAAHGHADAMSLQLYDHGEPVLTDGGTYLYHCPTSVRDRMRSELWHNTVCHAGHPQSEMLGAFMWGKQAEVKLEANPTPPADKETEVMEIGGHTYDGCPMRRRIEFPSDLTHIRITDLIHSADDTVSFITPLKVSRDGNVIRLGEEWRLITAGQSIDIEPIEISRRYGELTPATAIRLRCDRAGESTVILLKQFQSATDA